MSKFITEKNRQQIKESIGEVRTILFKVESTMHLDTDENILYHLNDDAKIRLDHMVQFLKTAQLFKAFEDNKNLELKNTK